MLEKKNLHFSPKNSAYLCERLTLLVFLIQKAGTRLSVVSLFFFYQLFDKNLLFLWATVDKHCCLLTTLNLCGLFLLALLLYLTLCPLKTKRVNNFYFWI
jgi:hypothetical protein